MVNNKTISNFINCEKIITQKNKALFFPESGSQSKINLASKHGQFFIYINRKNIFSEAVFSLILKHENLFNPLVRLDITGPSHFNQKSGCSYSFVEIPTPHIHLFSADDDYEFAYPINEKYAKMYIEKSDLNNYYIVLRHFMKYCNVSNISEYKILGERAEYDGY